MRSKTVNIYRKGGFIGCMSFDPQAGIWESSADLPQKTTDEIGAPPV
jgi:hypothetical protein